MAVCNELWSGLDHRINIIVIRIMKLVRIIIVAFYLTAVAPICTVLMAGLMSGAVLETSKAVKKP